MRVTMCVCVCVCACVCVNVYVCDDGHLFGTGLRIVLVLPTLGSTLGHKDDGA